MLAAAILLPGVGHVLAGFPQRGLAFLFFTLLLGTVTWQFTTPDQSFVGRAAGGLFVYAIYEHVFVNLKVGRASD